MRTSTTTALSTGALQQPVQSLESLREQLAQQRTAHSDAKRAVASTQVVWDATGDDASLSAHQRAGEAEQVAAARVARLERLVAAAESDAAAAESARLEQELNAIKTELASDPIGAKLEVAAVEALAAVADKLLAIREHRVARSQKQRKATSIALALGAPDPYQFAAIDIDPPLARIAEQVRERTTGLPSADPKCRYLWALSTIQPR
ncbi:MAG: hypothetical protein QM756_44740 [Polyangiaceae bacterium]